MDNKFEAYKQLKDSAIGKDLLGWMDDEFLRKTKEAASASAPNDSKMLGYAYGIMLVKQHIDSMASNKK